MAIELTSASKSTRLGVLSALNRDIWDVPLLDGKNVAGELLFTNEAVEGNGIPDGAGDSFIKTYNLTRTYGSGAFLFMPGSWGPQTPYVPNSFRMQKIISSGFSFPSLSAVYSGGQPVPQSQYLNPSNNGNNIIYINTDYTQARLFMSVGQSTDYPVLNDSGTPTPDMTVNKTYSELNNCLLGNYTGPFSGTTLFLAVNMDGSGGGKFVIKSIYISGSTLKVACKKVASTSGKVLTRQGFLLLDASVY